MALGDDLYNYGVAYFNKTGEADLIVSIKAAGKEKEALSGSYLFHKNKTSLSYND